MPARPLFLIAALRKTGSTVLSVALTDPPTAFVFREPRLLRGRLALKAKDVERFAGYGVDLASLADAPRPSSHAEAGGRFVQELLPRVSGAVEQVGIKEIRYSEGWRDALDAFPADMPIVAIGRDPRDLYVSLYRGSLVGELARLPSPVTPESVAADLLSEWRHMRELVEERNALQITYEDLCTDPGVLGRIKAHVGSEVAEAPELGEFRPKANVVHGDRITDRRIERWRQEDDPQVVADARRLAELMDDYRRFWGYPED